MTTTDLTASPPDHHSQNLSRLFYSLQNFPRLLKTFSKQTLDMIDMSRFSVRCALYSLMYRQMDDNKRLSGFWIRNQIDFAGVSNAVYFTREVASYCVAHGAAHAQHQHHHHSTSDIRGFTRCLTRLSNGKCAGSSCCLVSKRRV